MKNQRNKQIKYVLIIFGFVILFLGVKGLQKRFSKPAKVQRSVSELRSDDLERIKGNPDNSDEFANSLIRMAGEQNPTALEKLEILYNSNDLQMKSLALRGAGYFQDKVWLDRLSKIIKDTEDENTRLLAIQALGQRVSELRVTVLKEFLKNNRNSFLPYVAALESLAKVSIDPAEKVFVKQELLAIYKDLKNPNKRVALEILAQLFNKESQVIDLFKNIVKNENSTDEDLQTAVRTLAHVEDSWLKENTLILASSKNIFVQMALLENLAVYCPKNRFDFLKKIIESKSKNIILSNFLGAIEKLAEPEGLELLKITQGDKAWTPDEVIQIKKSEENLTESLKSKVKKACEN